MDELKRQARGLKLLNLCSGPARPDGIDVYVRELGAECVDIDLVLFPKDDITDDALWSAIRSDIAEGVYHGAGNAPPCSTLCQQRIWPRTESAEGRKSARTLRIIKLDAD